MEGRKQDAHEEEVGSSLNPLTISKMTHTPWGPQVSCQNQVFRPFQEGQKVGVIHAWWGHDVPQDRSHSKKGSSPGHCQPEFLDKQGLQHAPSANAGRVGQSHS